MEAGGLNMEVQLARMEGKIDTINERHAAFVEDVRDVKVRLNTHSERINELERDKDQKAGERKGMEYTLKVLWSIVGLFSAGGGLGLAAFLLRVLR